METAAIVTVGTIVVALIGGWFTYKSAKKTHEKTPQETINAGFTVLTKGQSDEITKLRRDVDEIKVQLTQSQKVLAASVRFIERLGGWIRGGSAGPMPTPPPDLHEYLDLDMWGLGNAGPPPRL